jgi:hypothetical protein|nr:MAG TPA: hypothetical protein [Caudoviricetes sp.]
MIWEELCEKAQELGYSEWGFCLEGKADLIRFYKNGQIKVRNFDTVFIQIAENRTPDQMYQIMLALKSESEE